MAKRNLFSVGDLDVDVLQEISKSLEFGEEHSLKDLDFSIGGNAANFAVIASKLGLRPKLISAIGRDFATGFLEKELSKSRVKHSLIRSRQPNAFSIISVNKRGERAIQSVKNCESDITAKKVARLLLPKLAEQDMVFFGGFYHLRRLRPGFSSLLRKIKAKGAVICFDTCFDTYNVWKIDGFLPFIDYLFVNDIELRHIAKGKTMQQRVNVLFRKGARVVAVKQASKGATLFVKGFKPTSFASLKPKVVDTTGAGDSFNAGFVFGLLRGWSLDNCMRAANFVAAKKIQVHGLVAPKVSAVERFIAVNNKPTLVVVRNYDEMSRLAAQRVINLLKRKPNASFLLPTGKTPEQMYNLLVKAHRKGGVSFKKASFFNLDDYVGLGQGDKSSFAFFLKHKFLDKVDAKGKNVHLLDGAAKNLRAEAKRHESAIQRKGIDLCILGIAPNGHVAFNEPGCCSYSITRVVLLKKSTIKKNTKAFPGRPVPRKGITVGIRTIRDNSKKIILLASGKGKARAVRALLKSRDFMKWPAVSLHRHRNFMVIADRQAASKSGNK